MTFLHIKGIKYYHEAKKNIIKSIYFFKAIAKENDWKKYRAFSVNGLMSMIAFCSASYILPLRN